METFSCKDPGQIEVRVKSGEINKVIYANKGDNLLEVLIREGVFVENPCGGKGICGKCRVIFKTGVKEPTDSDSKHLSQDEINAGARLSCRVKLESSAEVEIWRAPEKMDVLVEGKYEEVPVAPLGGKIYLTLAEPSLEDQRSDLRRLSDALGISDLIVEQELMSRIPGVLRDSNFKVTAKLYKNVLLDINGGDTSGTLYGAAVDIGTTTLACYLVDLVSGKVIDVESGVNSQRSYGADVISRINFTMEREDGLSILSDSVRKQICQMITRVCSRHNIDTKDLLNATIVGNTTMTHLFMGLPCKNISLSPYIPVTTDEVEFEGYKINMPFRGRVTVLPGVSGYIGSDITAGILACGMRKLDSYSLLLDLGTNGEIALGNKDGIITCSTAAGPAFEGANIKHGIGGIRGAISKVDLSKEIIYSTIGGAKACGICGSGVLDMVSQLLKYGILDETGRMVDEDEISLPESLKNRLTLDGNMKQFVIDENIVFTQKDVREVQLAKAAVHAGITILLKEKGIGFGDIENVFIAGGFGNFMDIESALNIGILPREFSSKVKSIGNSAGTGARMSLLSKTLREELKCLAQGTSYVELSGRQDFQDYFVDSMMFGG